MKRSLAIVLACLLFLAACGGDGDTTTATTTTTATVAPEATTVASTSTQPVAAPATLPKVPDAGSVDVAQFLRPGTSKVAVVYGDMNGVPPEEIALHSRSNQPGPNGLAAQEYVDAYSWAPGQKKWLKVFDATTHAGPILETSGGFNQSVDEPFAMVDFAGDGTPQLVFAVQSSGASVGPMSIWILSWLSEAFSTDFTFSTERGGQLTFNAGKTLTLDAPEYGPNDPGCCPSQFALRTIGYDPPTKKIKVLKTELRPGPQA